METSGTCSNHLVYSFLCNKKLLKVGLLKIPLFKIENNASAVYPHQTRAPYTTPKPTSLNDHIYTFLTSVLRFLTAVSFLAIKLQNESFPIFGHLCIVSY